MAGERKSDFSNHIYLYSFLLAILVVLVHAVNLAADGTALAELARSDAADIPMRIQDFFSNTLGQAAVPGYFLLSGFLFYRTLPGLADIPKKWQRRIRSLLIPYCSWNLLYYLLYAVCGRASLTAGAAFEAVLHYGCNPVFWYLWQLLLLTVLAPVIFLLTRCSLLSLAALTGTLFLVYFQIDIPLVNEDALFYYLLGACWAVYGAECFTGSASRDEGRRTLLLENVFGAETGAVSRKCVGAAVPAVCFFAAAVFFGIWQQTCLQQVAVRPLVLSTVLLRASLALGIWFLTGMLRLPALPRFMQESFFLYAVHYPIVRICRHLLSYILVRTGAAEPFSTICYFLTPLICVMIAHGMSAVLRSFVPQLYNILAGNR